MHSALNVKKIIIFQSSYKHKYNCNFYIHIIIQFAILTYSFDKKLENKKKLRHRNTKSDNAWTMVGHACPRDQLQTVLW